MRLYLSVLNVFVSVEKVTSDRLNVLEDLKCCNYFFCPSMFISGAQETRYVFIILKKKTVISDK